MANRPRAGHPEPTKEVERRDFQIVLELIRGSRKRAWAAVNLELVDLYWAIGEHISGKVAREQWGRGTVERLATWLASRDAGLRGFSASNLWRMRQFFDSYAGDPILAALLRELPWTSNVVLLGLCKTAEERAFYLRMAVDQRWDETFVSSANSFACRWAARTSSSTSCSFIAACKLWSPSRTQSPALVAEYETKLPDKALLRAKLDEIYELIASNQAREAD